MNSERAAGLSAKKVLLVWLFLATLAATCHHPAPVLLFLPCLVNVHPSHFVLPGHTHSVPPTSFVLFSLHSCQTHPLSAHSLTCSESAISQPVFKSPANTYTSLSCFSTVGSPLSSSSSLSYAYVFLFPGSDLLISSLPGLLACLLLLWTLCMKFVWLYGPGPHLSSTLLRNKLLQTLTTLLPTIFVSSHSPAETLFLSLSAILCQATLL